MGHNQKKAESLRRQRIKAREICELVLAEKEINNDLMGVLLCEGTEGSIDKVVYSAIFPDLLIVPMESCCNVMRILYNVKKILAPHELYAFGIIDRDALSKVEIKRMFKERGVYTTKLPFIENIVCEPGVIKYICEDLGLDYDMVIEKIHEQIMKTLWQKLKEALPINLGIERNERIETLHIGASTKRKNIEKVVNRENILYAYRSKVIVSIVASEMRMQNADAYYEKIKQLLADERYREKLIKVMASCIPKLELYNLEDF